MTAQDVRIAHDVYAMGLTWEAIAKAAIHRLAELEQFVVEEERKYMRLLAEHRVVLARLKTMKPATGRPQASGTTERNGRDNEQSTTTH